MISAFRRFKKNNYIKNLAKAIIPERLLQYVKKRNNRNIRIFFENHEAFIGQDQSVIRGLVPVLYWDNAPNFGDVIGPYLISHVTKKPVLNILDSSVPGFSAVGSILHLVNRKGMVVWGSGFIEEPSDELMEKMKTYNPEVLSVRGKESAKHLEKAGIRVKHKDALGDPALIMPLFYKPHKILDRGKIGVCPHYTHKSFFSNQFSERNNLNIIDVQNNLERVIDEITSSSVCISTSLHGLIIAQAYNIPWVWLEITDNNLIGNDFKFNDFFSMLNSSQVAHVKISLRELDEIDFETIAEKATLPEKKYKEELILSALTDRLKDLYD